MSTITVYFLSFGVNKTHVLKKNKQTHMSLCLPGLPPHPASSLNAKLG